MPDRLTASARVHFNDSDTGRFIADGQLDPRRIAGIEGQEDGGRRIAVEFQRLDLRGSIGIEVSAGVSERQAQAPLTGPRDGKIVDPRDSGSGTLPRYTASIVVRRIRGWAEF